MSFARNIKLYPLQNYTFSSKAPQYEKDSSVTNRLIRLKDEYKQYGMRRNIEACFLVHDHGHPHLLLLQLGTFNKLPSGELHPGEGELEGCKRILSECLSPENGVGAIEWEVADVLANWYRPNFDIPRYPYCPAHITKPKEHTVVMLIQLPENGTFAVPKNYKLVAAPLFELYESSGTYGYTIASMPLVLSRFTFVPVNSEPTPASPTKSPAAVEAPVATVEAETVTAE